MDSEAQKQLLSCVNLLEELNELIICVYHPEPHVSAPTDHLLCEARAIFSTLQAISSAPSIYDVVIDKRNNGNGYEYEALLILYT
jgi:hypothetical protein